MTTNPEFIDIPSHKFYGQVSKSPDGRYSITWRDGNDEGTRGGARTSGKGRYLLLDETTIITDGQMERPNDGKVANNGNFVLNDWRFSTNELRGTFYAFRADGSEIVRQKYKANLYNNGLSRDGRFAVCQTANSPDEHDGSILTIFALENGTEIARWRPESGWAQAYDFSDDGVYILLSYREGPPLRYTLTGEFIDRKLWVDSGLDRGDLRILSLVLKDVNSHPEGEFAKRLAASAEKALQSAEGKTEWGRAWALKMKGQCLDGLHEYPTALECYEEAMALDPKSGVKRRVEQLRKKLLS
jgi:hypothetical protein